MINANSKERMYRFARVCLLATVGFAADWIATGVIVFLFLLIYGLDAAFEECRRFIKRWRRFYRTGEWEWDLITER